MIVIYDNLCDFVTSPKKNICRVGVALQQVFTHKKYNVWDGMWSHDPLSLQGNALPNDF